MQLSSAQIELINAYGPYDHAVWRAGDTVVTHEQALAGRVELLAERVRSAIGRTFGDAELRSASILDVGCYDGWMLEQGLGGLSFGSMVGAEPREKNIVKGQKIREILELPSRAEYRCVGLDGLGDEQFDVVLCTGVLHHVESVGAAMRALRRVCRGLLFVETIVLPARYMTTGFARDMELKDLVYRYRPQQCGITGQKFESSYYDGSAEALSVVSIPSVETLQMHLQASGFGNVQVLADDHSARRTYRRWRSVCLSAVPIQTAVEEDWIADYELGMARTVLDREIVEGLYGLIGSPALLAAIGQLSEPASPAAAEIIRGFKFSPQDKVALEYGKILLITEPERGIQVLRGVTERLNADWRATYRAHYALWRAYEAQGEAAQATHHRTMCLTCNPRFPV